MSVLYCKFRCLLKVVTDLVRVKIKMFWVLVAVVVTYHVVTWALSRLKVGNYDKKHVFITGCDTGFGNLLAKRLDGLGFKVFAGCLTSAGAEKLQAACTERVTTLQLDVTDETSIAAAKEFVEHRLPAGTGLWGVVNNAGVLGPPAPSEWLKREDFMKTMSVNLFGMIDVTRAFLPLVRQARGRVVNISSTYGRISPGPAPYCVSKYGVEAFCDCLRREVYRQGVKVCILEPGFFKTDLAPTSAVVANFQRWYDATPADIRQHYMDPEKLAKLAEKLRAGSSDNLNLVVDAYELALTSRFPPTRQLVGWDVRLVYRLLWNLPTWLTDKILDSMTEK